MDEPKMAIHDLFGHVGKGLVINELVRALYGKHIQVRDNVFINNNCTFQDSSLINLANRVIIVPDTKFYCGGHSLDVKHCFNPRKDGSDYLITYTKPITVSNDVWIGGKVTVIGRVPAQIIKSLVPLDDLV